MLYDIVPYPKPRMSRSDVWKDPPRACVAHYRAFCDRCVLAKIVLPEAGANVTFYLPMPKSWNDDKKHRHRFQPHQDKPDLSNLLKALEDAVCKHDETIWRYGEIKKLWAEKGAILIY